MKDICLFDLDGTLTDSGAGITRSVSYALEHFGIGVTDFDELKKFIGPPLRDSFREYCNLSEKDTEAAVNKYREYYSKKGIFENTIYEGVVEALDILKGARMTMAIVTSKPTVYAERVARHFKIEGYFVLIAGSELDGTRVRKSELIEYALDIIDPERKGSSVMIGDREHDIIGAREAGIDSIGVTWGYGSRRELKEAQATAVVDSPSELCDTILSE
ncbi:MAG: HAD family hydrolase [Methanomassiliicoccaceae archaeon]|nr:HAD family hydrolase [Methanomassiliicoccaceae archaeon]